MKWRNYLLPGLAGLLALAASSCGDSEVAPSMPDRPEPAKFENSETFSGDNAWLHAKFLCELGPRPNGSKALERSRNYIIKQLQAGGWTVSQQVFSAPTPLGEREFVNLIARFQPEQGRKIATGLLCGHIDTKAFTNIEFIGANDGASHTALILETARILAKHPEHARQIELVFFDGEEAFGENIQPGKDGLFGSRHYAKAYRGLPDAKKPDWAIVVDMVGHRRLRIEVPNDSPTNLYQIYRKVAKELPRSRNRFGASSATIIDDHVPLNQAGIPAIDLIGDFRNGDWWHTEKDNFELLSSSSLELSGRLVEGMLRELLNQP